MISYSYIKQHDLTIMISLVICKRTAQKTRIISLIYLLMFIFQFGKLTGFHHKYMYKRPSVSSEEGKGLMKNMYA